MGRLPKSAILLLAMATFAGFCIITNNQGAVRKYADSSIPFIYRLHTSTPEGYIPAIEAGGNSWNNIQSSYFAFSRGAATNVTGPGMDGVSLVFFDILGVNFPPPTNVIAFSQTFTTSAGGYRAVESDLVWNARDFAPSPTGAPGQQDLESVIAHEFGHHLGLDHTGLPSGASSGCGPLVQAATMWWSSTAGDTTKRSLHPEDIMGVSALYPVWMLLGTITDEVTAPVANAPVIFVGTLASLVGPVENPIGNRYNRSGYVLDTVRTNAGGQYSTIVLDANFDVIVDGFGYERDSARIAFNPPGGIGQTQTVTHNVQISLTPTATFSGVIREAGTLIPVDARVEFHGIGDPEGLTGFVQTQSDGGYSIVLPSKESYNIRILPVAPYEDLLKPGMVYLPETGAELNLEIQQAEVLLVDDDAGAAYELYYQGSVERLGLRRRTFDVAAHGATPASVLASFAVPPTVVWFTGNDSLTTLTAEEKDVLAAHLHSGGPAIISGQSIAQSLSPDDPVLAGMFGIAFDGNTSSVLLRGFTGDVIGNGVNYLMVGGAPNQNSKDVLQLVPGSTGTPVPTLYYNVGAGDSTKLAGVRIEGPGGWAVSYFAFGLEGLSPARIDTFILRSLRYFDGIPVGVADGQSAPPQEFTLDQNYPNPFNPATVVRYGIPVHSMVSLKIYDVLGREITTLLEETKEAGFHDVVWNGRNSGNIQVGSGVYLFRMEAAGGNGMRFSHVRKMVLVR